MTKKDKKISQKFGSQANSFHDRLAKACDGLIYISETDSEIIPFSGETAEAVSADEIMRQAGEPSDAHVEEANAEAFFERLTTSRDWHGPREKEQAAKFALLRDELYSGLTDLKEYRVGRIRINIYIVGIDKEGRLAGVKTRAVET